MIYRIKSGKKTVSEKFLGTSELRYTDKAIIVHFVGNIQGECKLTVIKCII